ncbi:LLM class flavin-dependent oxidoreductase [Pseudonocardia sp. GCM10023141]|uniref:LLM class flavin-dependent oxidoreductase n=1 Tax=Pseudonocardia sp. GCM10023141 TaxID=3252653 RepID=UPI00361B4331
MQTGVLLPTALSRNGSARNGSAHSGSARAIVEVAVRAERLGYDSVWANDTLIGARIEPLTMLAAVAPSTSRVTLGTAALLPALRRPVHAAQAIASLDQLTDGRLTLAVGAGFPGRSEPEYAASEVGWARRFARLDDTVALWRQLWAADGPVSFDGAVLQLADVPLGTPPARPGGPPIWLAGGAPAALARAGRLYDGWLPYPPDPADYAAGLATVHAAAGTADRPVDAITPALFVTVRVARDVAAGRREVDAFCRASYGLPLEVVETVQTIVTGPAEHIAEVLAAYAKAGARHVVQRIAAPDVAGVLQQLDLLAPR